MPRLVVTPHAPSRRVIALKPGANSFGRSQANDFTIEDPSVSGTHCEIVVNEGSVVIRDLNSTNGTFVNRAPVREAVLQAGHSVHLGSVEMLFCVDVPVQAVSPAVAGVALPTAAPPPLPLEAQAVRRSQPPAAGTVRGVGLTAPVPVAAAPAPTVAPVLATGGSPPPTAAAATGAHYCKHHPKTPARYLCEHCHQYFCELCVSSRHVGPDLHKSCRHCGKEVLAFQFQLKAGGEKGFFARIPSAFLYPLRGAGVVIVIVGIVLVTLLKFGALMMKFNSLRVIMFGIILQIFTGGYLYSFLQNILHSTAAEEKELPDLPGISNFLDDIVLPFCRFLGLTLLCFGPAIAVGVWSVLSKNPMGPYGVYAAMIFGYLYFPMAFLAVAILDSIGAANPMFVVPSILKVPFEYLVSVLFLAGVYFYRALGDFLLGRWFPDGLGTDSMGKLFALIGGHAMWAFTSLYLLLVATHLLGLVYVAKRRKLGWLER